MRKAFWLALAAALLAGAGFAQQTGSISGRVTSPDGDGLAGVAVEATSSVLPRARTTVSGANGDFRLPLLPPGDYTLTFTMDQMATQTRKAQVLLQQATSLDVALAPDAVTESIDVVGAVPMLDPTSTELKSALSAESVAALPIATDYRDLIRLIPGVQYTENTVRGPSAGGSGQDNVYQFDGVNVTLPLFGTLSAEPSSHDIEQVATLKGGAKAVDFNRAGGFTVNTISKSGTNAFHGDVSFRIQTESMTADRDASTNVSTFDEDRDWTTFSLGGPVLSERLFFYLSYYRPTEARDNRGNLYGDVPDLDSVRNEYFGKLSFNLTDSVLLHASYRDSEREDDGAGVLAATTAGTASLGEDATLTIGIAEGSWVISPNSFANFRYTTFENNTSSRPDNLLDLALRLDGSVGLDVANLDRMGFFTVPNAASNPFLASLINRYGYDQNGVRRGGGAVGVGSQINDQNFLRDSFQVGYDHYLGENIVHELHVGYQYSVDEEELLRSSNGWGSITAPGGTTSRNGRPIYFQAEFQQMSVLTADGVLVDPIVSEYRSHNIELNDTIRLADFTFNVGLLVSNDELYGQGLRENNANVSGFELAPGNQYKMYELDFGDMLQPRLGVTWAPTATDTVFASFARYLPAASSLPRAASWARNTTGQLTRGFFDENGVLFATEQVGSSSGKFFQEDLDPRTVDEYLVGYSKQLTPGWAVRANARYRYGYNFWEDTNNDARLLYNPPEGVPRELYIPNLAAVRAEIGGSSYVIAELDGAFSKYWEASVETEWRGDKAFVKGSYVWSHYYGNFDQDNTTTGNDAAIFIGSSNLADGGGRQLWDNKYGNLNGDRRHQVKVYGYYNLEWNASVGAYAIYQSGQPWEAWDRRVYADVIGSSTSDVIRFAEPAGSRTTDAHHQLDLNYTQDLAIGDSRYSVQLKLDIFNVYDNQTGYNPQPSVNAALFGQSRTLYNPRRFQVSARFRF